VSVRESNPAFDQQAAALLAKLPTRPTLVVIGSTSCWHHQSPATCSAAGRLLASIENLVLVTGGVAGVGEGVGRSFFKAREQEGGEPDVFHILPHGCERWDYGVTLFAGSDMAERREILARLSPLYLAIEGGPGTVHEGQVALKHGAVVVPVGRSGGYAGALYATAQRPVFASPQSWQTLGFSEVTPEQVAQAAYDILFACLQNVP
jgi:predicted Rossmann-fold nucleotide-binding protein